MATRPPSPPIPRLLGMATRGNSLDFATIAAMGYPDSMFRPGICRACQLPSTDLRELESLRSRQRKLPHGMLARHSLSRWQWYRHFHKKCAGSVSAYWKPEEFARRRQQGLRLQAYWWQPGQSGGGNRKGSPDRRRRLRACGHAEALRLERAERAERLRRQRLAAWECLDR
jgi:hypothetical protein